MNESMIKLASRFIPGKKKRREFKEKHLQKLHAEQAGAYKKMKLIMTLVCKDEIDIIEKHLLFHHHMGVDGYIVTDNNSTDGTRELLENTKKKASSLILLTNPAPRICTASGCTVWSNWP